MLEPKAILESRWVKYGKKFIKEILVKWQNLPSEEAMWESTKMLKNQFPFVDLKDKCPLKGGSNDKSPRRSSCVSRRNRKCMGEV